MEDGIMAAGDYRSCDVCGNKAFYDANLNYETSDKVDGKWVYPEKPFCIAGENQGPYGNALDYVGDWAVICTDCSPRFKTRIVPTTLEPTAWMQTDCIGERFLTFDEPYQPSQLKDKVDPLYTHPAAQQSAKPLTDEQIKEIMLANGFSIKDGLTDLKPYVYAAARAIEAAHNIGVKP